MTAVNFGLTLVPAPRISAVFPVTNGYEPPTITILGEFLALDENAGKDEIEVKLRSADGAKEVACAPVSTSGSFTNCLADSYPEFEQAVLIMSRLGAESEPYPIGPFAQPPQFAPPLASLPVELDPIAAPSMQQPMILEPLDTTLPEAAPIAVDTAPAVVDRPHASPSTEAPTAAPANNNAQSDSLSTATASGLSGGAITGILLGAVAALALIATILLLYAVRKANIKTKERMRALTATTALPEPPTANFT
jgi:hypothetical protein